MCKVKSVDFYELLMQLMESTNRLDASVRALTDLIEGWIDFDDIDWDVEDGE